MGIKGKLAMAGVVVVGVVGALIAPASAGGPKVATQVTVYDAGSVGESEIALGRINSDAKRCLKHRKIKGVVTYPSTPNRVLDRGWTSDEGSWGLRGPSALLDGADGGFIKVARLQVGRKGHERICKAARGSIN